MATVKELLRAENDGTLSFGNYEFDTKQKLSDFEYEGDLYKVKTFKEITKLEKNGMFVYESVPGTTVTEMKTTENEMNFQVEGWEDCSITVELEPDTEYKVFVDGTNIGKMKTNLAGKISISIEIEPVKKTDIQIVKY